MPAISATQTVTEIRPSDYGTYLRLPADLVPFQRSLGTVGEVGTNIDLPDCVGGGPGGKFSLKSDDICRFHLLSAGAYLFASAQPSSVFQAALGEDNFNRANENPATGWTAVSSTNGGVQVSANQCLGSAADIINMTYFTASPLTGYQEVQADYQVSDSNRIGVTTMTQAGPSAYSLWAQWGTPNTTIRLDRTIALLATTLGSWAGQGLSAGTMKLTASADATTVYLSAFKDGSYLGGATDATPSRLATGYPGIFMTTRSGGFVSAQTYIDNWQSLQIKGPPYDQPDIVLGASADGWIQRGQTEATRWAQFYFNDLRLGVDSTVTFAGNVSVVVSAGASAFLPTTTYGVVQTRVSSVSSTNLGAGHSTSNGLIVAIVDASSLCWYASGTRMSAAGAVF